MRPPPSKESRPGDSPVRRLWTRKESGSSRVLRLATRLGEMSWRDRVRVLKARRPETASPEVLLSVVSRRETIELLPALSSS